MKLPFDIDLTGKVCVVTGAGGVLCSMFAEALAKTGAKVALLDLNVEAAISYAEKIAKEKNLPLISNKNDISFFTNPLPNDFLSWLLNAEYVVTNSFHGTVFSLLFHKQFVSHILNSSGETKKCIVELLKTVNLVIGSCSNKYATSVTFLKKLCISLSKVVSLGTFLLSL